MPRTLTMEGNKLVRTKFGQGEIFSSHYIGVILECDKEQLLEFLVCRKHSYEDNLILEKWILYYKRIDVPFLVIENGNVRTMWKERRI